MFTRTPENCKALSSLCLYHRQAPKKVRQKVRQGVGKDLARIQIRTRPYFYGWTFILISQSNRCILPLGGLISNYKLWVMWVKDSSLFRELQKKPKFWKNLKIWSHKTAAPATRPAARPAKPRCETAAKLSQKLPRHQPQDCRKTGRERLPTLKPYTKTAGASFLSI